MKEEIGLITEERRQELITILGRYINQLGDKVYHIGKGCHTGQSGWDMFQKEIEKNGFRNLYAS